MATKMVSADDAIFSIIILVIYMLEQTLNSLREEMVIPEEEEEEADEDDEVSRFQTIVTMSGAKTAVKNKVCIAALDFQPLVRQFVNGKTLSAAAVLATDRVTATLTSPLSTGPGTKYPQTLVLDQSNLMEIKPIKGFALIPLMIFGIPGNVYIMLKFILVRFIEKKLLPTSIILTVLALMNLLVLLARGTPEYMYITGFQHLLNDAACKLIVYTYRTSRAMSISITSLLSCHQCILIAPTTRVWVYLKPRMSKNMVVIIIAIFIINMLLYCSSVTFAHAKSNSTNTPYTLHLVSCRTDFLTQVSFIINGTLLVVKDFILVTLMTLTSTYIVNVLLHHQKKHQGHEELT
ncbi:unnamed protein product [Ranitomeya imitator]|uniref:Vomeronasal type-1 receptor n=1 Tax=Ranitomeya imitator TaxID=111125 RepID=A0ABN9MNU7_9NEOB|nr:unnamed protein product [Ranitomeya imitator]